MSMPNLLSQEEIDVLLDCVQDGDFATETVIKEFLPPEGAKAYDFSRRERLVRREQIQTLERINDRFTSALRTSLFRMLLRAPQMAVSGIQLQTFSDFVGRLRSPINLNIVRMAPLRGRALIVMDSRLVFTVVDNFFGGNGQFDHYSESREFTRIEMRVIRKILDNIFKDLKDAWEPVLAIDVDCLGSEINPKYAAIAGANDYVLTSTVNISLEGNGGDLTILMPYAMIEPVSDLLDAAGDDGEESNPEWRGALADQMMDAKVNINSLLAEKNLFVSDVLRLKKGDIIPIDMPNIVSLLAEGVPLFSGRVCTSEGRQAVQVIEKIGRNDTALSGSGVDKGE